jgi:hypothetical protein
VDWIDHPDARAGPAALRATAAADATAHAAIREPLSGPLRWRTRRREPRPQNAKRGQHPCASFVVPVRLSVSAVSGGAAEADGAGGAGGAGIAPHAGIRANP